MRGRVYHWHLPVPESAPSTVIPLLSEIENVLGRALSGWVDAVLRRPRSVALACLGAAALLALHAAATLGLNTNENDLFSQQVPYQALRADWSRAFPTLVDPLVVVVDGSTADLAQEAAQQLADALAGEPDHFGRIHRPGGGAFFERHGLLYLDPPELEDLLTNLHGLQPFLAALAGDPSLRGLARMLERAAAADLAGELEELDLLPIVERVAAVTRGQLEGEESALSLQEMLRGEKSTRRDRRRFLLVQPSVDFQQLQPAEASLQRLRVHADRVMGASEGRVRVRATGVFPLSYEEMEHLDRQTTLAGVVSFCAVGLLLAAGLGSARLVASSLTTLLAGLGATAGFAAIAIGHLNLISVAFAVLFIGLSIDFAIHLCVRFRERLGEEGLESALARAAADVGPSLCVCAVTTAIGFFSFAPTEYAGVAELGIIAGTGMFISLAMNLTLLPALIAWWVTPESVAVPRPLPARIVRLLAMPASHPRSVLLLTGLVGLAALWQLPNARFDPNPLRVRDPSTPSVQVFEEMLEDGDALPWTLNVLASDHSEARRRADRLERLPGVASTLTLADLVPEDQEEKLASIQEAAFVLLPVLASPQPVPAPDDLDQQRALAKLARTLDRWGPAAGDPRAAELAARLAEMLQLLAQPGSDPSPRRQVELALVGGLPASLRAIRRGLEAAPVTLADLPAELRDTHVAVDGRVRVEIQPRHDLGDSQQLASYVREVQEVAPDAFGEALVIHETGEIVVGALRQALLTAACAIAALLLLLWRSLRDASLVALPLALAALLTTSASSALGVPFNFANVIVIPLLLGMGVDTGIHLVHRVRGAALPDGNLLRTSTAFAVLLSALTTVASFGSLGLSSHLGMASLGRLLALGIALILICNLGVLPALLRLARRR